MSTPFVRFALCRSAAIRRCSGSSIRTVGNNTRFLSQTAGGDNSSKSNQSATKQPDWRKRQLDQLEKRFSDADHAVNKIQEQDDLQPMWKEMESRVAKRRSRTLEQNKGKIGRANVRKTDEDVWLQEGLYDELKPEK